MGYFKNWDFHRFDTTSQLRWLEIYIDTMETQFENIKNQAERKLPKKPEYGDQELYDLWKKVEIDPFVRKYKDIFPSKLRYSAIVLIWIFLETRLREMCKEIEKRKKLRLKEKDFKGPIIERCKTYLEKVCDIRIEEKIWSELMDVQKIRNCIIHANGSIKDSSDNKYLKQLTKNEEVDLEIDYEGFLLINREYVLQLLVLIKKFFDQAFDRCGFGKAFPESFDKT